MKVAIVALVLVASVATAGDAREDRLSYVAGTGDVAVLCPAATRDTGPLGPLTGIRDLSVGGVCFTLQGGERHVAIEIVDDVGGHVGGLWRLRDASNTTILQSPFCGTSATLVPPNAVSLMVLVDEAHAVFDCPLGGPSATGGAGVLGDVYARWS